MRSRFIKIGVELYFQATHDSYLYFGIFYQVIDKIFKLFFDQWPRDRVKECIATFVVKYIDIKQLSIYLFKVIIEAPLIPAMKG